MPLAAATRLGAAKQLLSLMMKTAQNATTDSSANRNTSRDQADLDLVRGEIALAEDKPDEAVKLFESARLIEPRVAEILESLAFALVAAGRLEDAAGRYEELLSMRPLGGEGQEVWVRAHVMIGDVYERLGRVDAARASYERLLTLWKNGDADLVALNEAKTRLAKLKAGA
jgi:tetratricopeptide (TPR) repeat protein